MDFSQYLINRLKAIQGAGGFGSLTLSQFQKQIDSASIFTTATKEDLEAIDYDKLMAEQVSQNNDSLLEEMIQTLLELEDVEKAADTDGDGTVSGTEAETFINSIMGKDGSADSLSFADIDKAIEGLGVDLEKTAKTAIEEAVAAVEKELAAEEPEEVETPDAPQSTGGGGGSTGGTGNGNKTDPETTEPETAFDAKNLTTVADCDAKITELKGEKDAIDTAAQTAVEEQQTVIDTELSNNENGFTDAFRTEYANENNRLQTEVETKITARDDAQTAVDNKQDQVDMLTESVTALTSTRDSLQSQYDGITIPAAVVDPETHEVTNQGEIDRAEDYKAEVKAKLDAAIADLESKEQEKSTAEGELTDLQGDLEDAVTELSLAETEQADLFETLLAKHQIEVPAEVKQKIQEAQSAINTVNNEAHTQKSGIDRTINEVENQKEYLKLAEISDEESLETATNAWLDKPENADDKAYLETLDTLDFAAAPTSLYDENGNRRIPRNYDQSEKLTEEEEITLMLKNDFGLTDEQRRTIEALDPATRERAIDVIEQLGQYGYDMDINDIITVASQMKPYDPSEGVPADKSMSTSAKTNFGNAQGGGWVMTVDGAGYENAELKFQSSAAGSFYTINGIPCEYDEETGIISNVGMTQTGRIDGGRTTTYDYSAGDVTGSFEQHGESYTFYDKTQSPMKTYYNVEFDSSTGRITAEDGTVISEGASDYDAENSDRERDYTRTAPVDQTALNEYLAYVNSVPSGETPFSIYDVDSEEIDLAINDEEATTDLARLLTMWKNSGVDISNLPTSIQTTEALFSESEYNVEYVTNGAMKYMLIAPKDLDPNTEHPMLVYLHGSGEVGRNPEILSQLGSGQALLGSDMETFNGYILYPVTNSNWETEGAEESLRAVIEEFTSSHKVDTEQIAIAGHSLGGKGAIYMAKHMEDVFSSAAVLSGYNTRIDISDINIPIRGYVGSRSGDSSSYTYMTGAFDEESLNQYNANHGGLPAAAFNDDSDGNNRSDILEWLFSTRKEK